jgi:formylglycine-generating enzyme required for sulfatase activity
MPARLKPYAIATTTVTVDQFRAFMQPNQTLKVSSGNCPVVLVSWSVAAAYCNWLSKQEGIPERQWYYPPPSPLAPTLAAAIACGPAVNVPVGTEYFISPEWLERERRSPQDMLERTGYRLPTTAEWEYACRAGARTPWYFGEADEELVGHYAWWLGNSISKPNGPFPVALLKPNDRGLFDMHGNVYQWCEDASQIPGERLFDVFQLPGEREIPAPFYRAVRGQRYTFRLSSETGTIGISHLPMQIPSPVTGFRLARSLR